MKDTDTPLEGESTCIRHLPEVANCLDRFRTACVRYWATRDRDATEAYAASAERLEAARRAFAAGILPDELRAVESEVRR